MGPGRRLLVAALPLLVACTVVDAGQTGAGVSSLPPGGGPTGMASTAPLSPLARPAAGILRLTIRWPVPREPFRTTVVPNSAQSLLVTVVADGETLAERLVPRVGATASVEFALAPRNNVTVRARAYDVSTPDLATETPIAEGHAAGLNLVSSLVTPARVTLVPLEIPRLVRLGLNVGRAGTSLVLYGEHFRPDSEVWFSGRPAAEVTYLDASALRVRVPAGAVSGPITLRSDGIPSATDAWFWVLDRVVLSQPAKESWDASTGSGERQVRFGSEVVFPASASWVLPAQSVTGAPPEPQVTNWYSSDARGGTFAADGRFTAGSVRQATTIVAGLGSLLSNSIRVLPAGKLDGIGFGGGTLELFSLPATGDPGAGHLVTAPPAVATHDLPRSPRFTCTSSRPDLVSCDEAGVRTTRAQEEGVATLTATLVDVPSMVATIDVRVHASGSLSVDLE